MTLISDSGSEFAQAAMREALDGRLVKFAYPLAVRYDEVVSLFRLEGVVRSVVVDAIPLAGRPSQYLSIAMHVLKSCMSSRHKRLVLIPAQQKLCRLLTFSSAAKVFLVPRPDPEEVGRALLTGINEARANQGLDALICSAPLTRAAELHCEELAHQALLSHKSLDGRSPLNRAYAQACKYRSVGETTVRGLADAAAILAHWLYSPNHRSIVLDPSAREVGIARLRMNQVNDPILVAVYGGGRPRRWFRRAYSHLRRLGGFK